MSKKKRKLFKESRSTKIPLEKVGKPLSPARLPDDYSPPTLSVKGTEELNRTISFDVQLTVRFRVDITRNQACMLAGMALFQVQKEGVTLTDWMILEFLYSYLLGSKPDGWARNDPKEREISLLLKVVLLSATWQGLEEKKELPEDIRQFVRSSRFVPNERTFQSWKQTWELKKYIEFRAVPLERLFERSKTTTPYSSYCKGYGESNRMGRRQRTKPSAELDGEPIDLDVIEKSVPLRDIGKFLQIVSLELKYKTKER